MTAVDSALDQLCVNTIRTLAIDMVQKADSGHPGLPLGAAPMAFALWQQHLSVDPESPDWPDRDRFVLSAGHGSALLYALLHLYGYAVTEQDLRDFRQWGSITPGHPEVHMTPGVEATTGPLGQGSANAVGMALAERVLAQRFNRPGFELFDHCTYALVSDGDLMEGLSAEAGSLAGHLKLGKLIYLYDSNDVCLDGPLSMTFDSNEVGPRYAAYGWQVLRVEDGDRDLAALDRALQEARADLTRPTLIEIKTTIGFGSPKKAGTADAHGSPLGDEEVQATKQALGWTPTEAFAVPAETRERFAQVQERGRREHQQWRERFDAYAREFPELARECTEALAGELPSHWREALPRFEVGEKLATRVAGGKVLNALAARIPFLMGGDADLSCSTKTAIQDGGSFEGTHGTGRNIHFGVREHAMGAIANGMALHGGVRPFTGTFFCFADYMRPAMRLAALSELPVIHVFTHDSIGVGEDGPTHQPVEHVMSLRVMPNLSVVRPADAAETAAAWSYALERKKGPTVLVLTRQGLPVLERIGDEVPLERGAYVLREATGGTPRALLLATGSEVALAVAAAEELDRDGVAVRVVSMPCWEAFQEQDSAYRESVLPAAITARVSVEAGTTLGWERWIGSAGIALGLDRFGASAPGNLNFEKLGFTVSHVTAAVKRLLG